MVAIECSICYEAITSSTGKVVMSCKHTFHFKCLTTWFQSQEKNELASNCPCCRHEATEYEAMPVSSHEETYVDNVIPEDFPEPLDFFAMAAQERAQDKFARYKSMVSEEQFQAAAATIIASCVRGFFARKAVRNYILERNVRIIHMQRLYEAKCSVRKGIITSKMYEKALHMPRPAWLAYMATYIQRGWRAYKAREKADKDAVSAALSKGLLITWKRVAEHRWERIVLNPEERNAQTYSGPITGTPPQSLAFETACAATKIAAVWKGYTVRRDAFDMKIMYEFAASLLPSYKSKEEIDAEYEASERRLARSMALEPIPGNIADIIAGMANTILRGQTTE
jgi:hypothetical protein